MKGYSDTSCKSPRRSALCRFRPTVGQLGTQVTLGKNNTAVGIIHRPTLHNIVEETAEEGSSVTVDSSSVEVVASADVTNTSKHINEIEKGANLLTMQKGAFSLDIYI